MNNIYRMLIYAHVCFVGLPNRPGTPEIPQKYNNTALVLWRPSDTMAPCTYSLERRAEGQSSLISIVKPDLNEFAKIRVGCLFLILLTTQGSYTGS